MCLLHFPSDYPRVQLGNVSTRYDAALGKELSLVRGRLLPA